MISSEKKSAGPTSAAASPITRQRSPVSTCRPGWACCHCSSLLVRVLDHHHRRIDHCADRDRDAAERHDVGVHPLVVHDDERDQHAERERDDRDERRAQVEQEDDADERDDDELLDELVAQMCHGALDQLRAIVGFDDLDAGRAGSSPARRASPSPPRWSRARSCPRASRSRRPPPRPRRRARRCPGASRGRPVRAPRRRA